jgi:AraC family transcriptional regulator
VAPVVSTLRIGSIRSGRSGPIVPQHPLLSSARSVDWHGLILERHIADPVYDARDTEASSIILHFFEGPPLTSEWRFDGHFVRVVNLPGSVTVEPNGFHFDVHAVRPRPAPQWILALDQPLFGQRLAETVRGGRVELAPTFNLVDAQIVTLCRLLQADLEAGSPSGPLFGELVGAALAVQLTQRCSTSATGPFPARGGLPPARLRRVIEYIDANLDIGLRLSMLAREAGVSAFHFARLFKQSTGNSPHQYLLQRRLDRAKTMLRQPEMRLTDISASTGFADQSHFAKVFRRFTGVTPSEYRSQR